MKAKFNESLVDGTPNPALICAVRVLEVINKKGRVRADDLGEEAGNIPKAVLVPVLKALIDARDILRIDEGGTVFLEPLSPDRSHEPKAVRLVLENLISCKLSQHDPQPKAVSFAPIIDKVAIPEIEEAISWLISSRIIERCPGNSTFKIGPRWKEAVGGMNISNISVGAVPVGGRR